MIVLDILGGFRRISEPSWTIMHTLRKDKSPRLLLAAKKGTSCGLGVVADIWMIYLQVILLMEEILHQLIGSLPVYLIIYKVLYVQTVVQDITPKAGL